MNIITCHKCKWQSENISDCENALKYKQSPLADKDMDKINRMIQNCEFAINAMKSPVNFDPVNLGSSINTELPEYFPSVTADDSTFYLQEGLTIFLALWEDKKIFLFLKNKWKPMG